MSLLSKKNTDSTGEIIINVPVVAPSSSSVSSGSGRMRLIQSAGMVYELSPIGQLRHYCYELGFYVEYSLVKFWRNFVSIAVILRDYIADGLGRLVGSIFKTIVFAIGDFFSPILILFRAGKNIFKIFADEGHYGARHLFIRIADYLKIGIKKHLHLTLRPFNYISPIVAFIVFAYTATTVFAYTYVLEVKSNDQPLGYVESDAVLETAKQTVKNRILYQGAEREWSITPTFNISIANTLPEDITSQDNAELANAIISSSGEEILEGTGFFIDGVFHGATLDKIQLEEDINDILAPYKSDNPNISVDFVHDVEMVDGIYLKSSMVEHNSIQDLISNERSDNIVEYIVKSGETSAEIAARFTITSGELAEYNPSIDFDSLKGGETLIVKKVNPFLAIKEIERVVYEEEILYETVRTSSNKMSLGVVKTDVKGQKGINRITADIVRIDGAQTQKDIVVTEIIREPVDEMLTVGTAIGYGGFNYDYSGPALGTGALQWPTGGGVRVSRGFTGVHAHNGMDIAGPGGTPIYAADAGVVVQIIYGNTGYGRYLMIDHGNGIHTLYGHNSAIHVSVGDSVAKGAQIASMGSTGRSTGNHVHFEVIQNGTRVNPAGYL